MAERRGRIVPEQVDQALSLMDGLPLEEDDDAAQGVSGKTLALARKHDLTIYDAAYLELAQRRRAILATFDHKLLKAAKREKIPIE